MKFLGLIFFSATLIGCGSQDIGKSPDKSATGQADNQSLTFLAIKPASGLADHAKPIKKGKAVEVNGAVIEVSTLGGSDTFVEEANNGFVVGGSSIPTPKEEIEGEEGVDKAVHAFVQKDGVIKDLGTLGGAYSSASSVNSTGIVVGGSELLDRNSQAFKYENNAMSGLPNLSGGNHSWAHSINNSNYIVGEAKDSTGAFKAVLWHGGSVLDLNSLLPANSGWVLTSAKSITNSGVVSGVGRFNGQVTYFQLNLNITE